MAREPRLSLSFDLSRPNKIFDSNLNLTKADVETIIEGNESGRVQARYFSGTDPGTGQVDSAES